MAYSEINIAVTSQIIMLRSFFVPLSFLQTRSSGKVNSLNGWEPNEDEFAWGLPGALDPVGNFDPAGFADGCTLDEMKRYREAEITHGRVSMLAVIGFLVGENFHPLFGLDGKEILGIQSLTEVRQVFPEFFELLAIVIGVAELGRALTGWKSPQDRSGLSFLNEEYYPGDINFDPLGLKPEDPAEFREMATKEIQNGRLAMLAIAGFVAQELVDGKPILLNDFGI